MEVSINSDISSKEESHTKIIDPNSKPLICILHTRAGCIPHLTADTLNYLDKSILPNMFCIPLPSIVKHQETICTYNENITQLFALNPNDQIYLSIQDSSLHVKKGHNTKKSVAVWETGGKVNVTPESFMELVESLQPFLYECLADGDVNVEDTPKRAAKSVDRTIQHLQACLARHKNSIHLKSSKLVCLIEGGYCSKARMQCVELTLNAIKQYESLVWGFLIDGLHFEVPLPNDSTHLLSQITSALPSNKPIAVFGQGHPIVVIELIKLGVSVFDTSYITKQSEENKAFVYPFPTSMKTFEGIKTPKKQSEFMEVIDLSVAKFADNFAPIVIDCTCYTCNNHTRAYIHHLVNTKEMLAPVLLMLHNLHHFLQFFSALKTFKSLNELDNFKLRLLGN